MSNNKTTQTNKGIAPQYAVHDCVGISSVLWGLMADLIWCGEVEDIYAAVVERKIGGRWAVVIRDKDRRVHYVEVDDKAELFTKGEIDKNKVARYVRYMLGMLGML